MFGSRASRRNMKSANDLRTASGSLVLSRTMAMGLAICGVILGAQAGCAPLHPSPTLPPSEWRIATIFEKHDNIAQSLAWHPRGTLVATGDWDGHIYIWDARTGTVRAEVASHKKEVWAVSFSEDERFLVSTDSNTVRIWEVAAQKNFREMTWQAREEFNASFTSALFIHQSRRVALGAVVYSRTGDAAGVYIWDPETQTVVHEGREYDERGINAIGGSRRIEGIVSGGRDGVVRLWTRGGASWKRLYTHSTSVSDLSVSRGQVASCSEDGEVTLYDAELGRILWKTRLPDRGTAVAVSHDGEYVAAANSDGSVFVCRATDGSKVFEANAHKGKVCRIAFAPEDYRFASSGADGKAVVWSPK